MATATKKRPLLLSDQLEELLTLVKDTDVDDLRDKAAKEGGNAVLVTGQAGADASFIIPVSQVKYIGEVYRCP